MVLIKRSNLKRALDDKSESSKSFITCAECLAEMARKKSERVYNLKCDFKI